LTQIRPVSSTSRSIAVGRAVADPGGGGRRILERQPDAPGEVVAGPERDEAERDLEPSEGPQPRDGEVQRPVPAADTSRARRRARGPSSARSTSAVATTSTS
jgi:hypothetical protein